MDPNAAVSPDPDSTNDVNSDDEEFSFSGGDIDWTDVDPASVAGDPQEGVAAELQYLVLGVGERDPWGVLITAHEEESYADVELDVPRAAPAHTLPRLEALRHQRILFTDEDRERQEYEGTPYKWGHASWFAATVYEARARARDAVTDAAFETLGQIVAGAPAGVDALEILRLCATD
ncbi:hypothetical protein ACI7YT_09100 [Microbacterium sp. M]|uniref:hypothetical protein n=1 Tax=Microbacterium sp. M TaxID=3377125 RepID=UPI003870BFE1